ncbi:MAG: metallophosphoesterase [Prosthecochloris sp.]|uniref:metallophosphoesterase n=1 Tax=Prosthecochloris sp. TaxID=290513 RepID=UPI0013C66273|nr:metallophosphoesterase [Prosthecochloris sp.]NEX12592.1 metallophosphoesterase [Prosthecochloris sp.]
MTGSSITVRFGIIADIHMSDCAAEKARTVEDLEKCIDSLENEGITHLIQMGDLVEGPQENAEQQLDEVSAILNRFSGTIHHIIGNHCLDVPITTLMHRLTLATPYYTFRIGALRCIALHGMDITVASSPESPADRERRQLLHTEAMARQYTGAIGQQQIDWLKHELQTAADNREKVIICSHLPLHPETTDERHGILWNHREITNLLSGYPDIIACISGHYHPGGSHRQNGVHFLTIPAFCRRSEPPFFSYGIVEIRNTLLTVDNPKSQPH